MIKMLCQYGCGKEGNYQLKNGKWCCESSFNKCSYMRLKNSISVKNRYKLGVTKHYTEESRKKQGWNRGLTKESSRILFEQSERTKEKFKKGALSSPFKDKKHSSAVKDKISIARNKSLAKSEHIKWYQLPNGLNVQGMWEYNIGMKLLKNGYSITRESLKYSNHRRYTPDFKIGDNTYIEVKGWLSNRDVKKYNFF